MDINLLSDHDKYEFDEQLEVRDKVRESLLWVRRGFCLAEKLTPMERKVAYDLLFARKSQSEIAEKYNLSRQRIGKISKNIKSKGFDVIYLEKG